MHRFLRKLSQHEHCCLASLSNRDPLVLNSNHYYASFFLLRRHVTPAKKKILRKGLKVDPAKVEAKVSIQPLKTVIQVQSFLQSCSWSRLFIPNFADISGPLSNLTQK
ncbi:hypothetical protein CEXT_812851 [Caerostris extrusa]|uniref:Uncharacterized protein n=1 Tax=Caerostris extrusa TaxID=172846 RepID=A0AAV4NC98_CAEEX|nr:hypothetical protein CEXT_812851 [Caerostris extrusa]